MLEKDVEYFILQRPLKVYVHFFFSFEKFFKDPISPIRADLSVINMKRFRANTSVDLIEIR